MIPNYRDAPSPRRVNTGNFRVKERSPHLLSRSRSHHTSTNFDFLLKMAKNRGALSPRRRIDHFKSQAGKRGSGRQVVDSAARATSAKAPRNTVNHVTDKRPWAYSRLALVRAPGRRSRCSIPPRTPPFLADDIGGPMGSFFAFGEDFTGGAFVARQPPAGQGRMSACLMAQPARTRLGHRTLFRL
jgi:hypothetical protein